MNLEEMALIEFKSHTAVPALARIRGFLLKQIIENFQRKINDSNHFSFVMSAGHDYTIISLLNILGLFNVSKFRIFKS